MARKSGVRKEERVAATPEQRKARSEVGSQMAEVRPELFALSFHLIRTARSENTPYLVFTQANLPVAQGSVPRSVRVAARISATHEQGKIGIPARLDNGRKKI